MKHLILSLALIVPVAACGSSDKPSAESAKQMAASRMDIVDTAVAAGNFNTLVAAVKAAGLVETLKGDGPFTVFAPTDAAFKKLPEGTVEKLLGDKEALTKILVYHVVAGEYPAEQVMDMASLESLQGSPIEITKTDGVKVGGAEVVQADIKTSNGVIHAIDTVIMPPQ